MITEFFIFVVALGIVVRGATLATRYAAQLAESYHLSQYVVGFFIIAVISILPETFIAINAALTGMPSFGFGMLIGSNVADLTLVVAIITFFARRPLKIESKILTNHALYPFLLLLPIVLGFDGHLSRPEGGALLLAGAVFYYHTLRRKGDASVPIGKRSSRKRDVLFLTLSIALLLFGSHFVVTSASAIAQILDVNPVIIGMLIVGLGTIVPETFFALNATKTNHDALAVGDVLGTVLADATIVVGILALINPFTFPTTIIYVAGVFMVSSAFILFSFMRSGKAVTGKEAFALLVLWLTFIAVEMIINA